MKKLNFTKAILLGAAVCLMTNVMNAQMLHWANRYASTGILDLGYAVHEDGSGNIYTAGQANVNSSDAMVLIKYNPAGTQQWVAPYNGTNGVGYAIAQDAAGYIYVAGSSIQTGMGADITLIKYNTAGVAQWAQPAIYGSTGFDVAYDIAITPSNYIYLAGESNGNATLLRYNTAGAFQWAYTYSGTASGSDRFSDLDLPVGYNEPNIYLTGVATMGNGALDALTVKVNSGGSAVWEKTFDGSGGLHDEGYKLKVDRQQYVYVAGRTEGTSSSYQDGLVLKYNNAGTLQWSKTYDGTAYTSSLEADRFYSIDLIRGTNPDIYVTGMVQQGQFDIDYITCKYNSAGTLQWAMPYDGNAPSTGSNDQAYSVLRSTNTGKIYVTGTSQNINQGLNIATIRYNPSTGAQEWVGNFNHGSNLNDTPWKYRPLALGYDAFCAIDLIYITGQVEHTPAEYDIITLKYGQSGDPCRIGQFVEEEFVESPPASQLEYGLYPNPFTDFATLYINAETEITNGIFSVYDLFGKMVSSIENISSNKIIIERGNMPAGIYVYRFNSNGNSAITGKMIIQ